MTATTHEEHTATSADAERLIAPGSVVVARDGEVWPGPGTTHDLHA